MDKKDTTEEKLKLKEIYNEFKKKYNLPDYDLLYEDFEIEKKDYENEKFILRNIRRVIGEKIESYKHLFEVLINPSSPPIYIYTFLKNLDLKQKQEIKDLYTFLSRNQVKLIQLDTIYNEDEEARFIETFFEKWQSIKKDIYAILESIDLSFDTSSNSGGRSYLG